MTTNPVQRQRFLLSPDKRYPKPYSRDSFDDAAGRTVPEIRDEVDRRDGERQRAKSVHDAARMATLWMRDAIRAIEDLDYVDRVGFLAEGADRLDAVALELDQRLERLQTTLRAVLTAHEITPNVYVSNAAIESDIEKLMKRSPAMTAQVHINNMVEHVYQLSGNDALRTEPAVPKPGQHLKSRPSGKPAGLSDRHGGALNPPAAPDGSGPGGGG
ncbi:hypothetical protein [Rhodococcus sp. KRD162]|uniref:hypothetical protein n=1 Tax=Rhodococcus sp. KRD162 TaxID=2729725 RepID=UPI0019CF8311|nr:hypothetical protein [Rhodococcus sp. KRD162]